MNKDRIQYILEIQKSIKSKSIIKNVQILLSVLLAIIFTYTNQTISDMLTYSIYSIVLWAISAKELRDILSLKYLSKVASENEGSILYSFEGRHEEHDLINNLKIHIRSNKAKLIYFMFSPELSLIYGFILLGMSISTIFRLYFVI